MKNNETSTDKITKTRIIRIIRMLIFLNVYNFTIIIDYNLKKYTNKFHKIYIFFFF